MSPKPKPRKVGLFDLPAEIRNRILLDVATYHSNKANGTPQVFTIQTLTMGRGQLFRSFYANKQMLREMRALFFGNNVFSLVGEAVRLYSQTLHRLPNGMMDDNAFNRSFNHVSNLKFTESIFKALNHNTRITFGLNKPRSYSGLPLMTMLTPHPAVRSFIRFLQLHLEVPDFGSEVPTYDHVYGGDQTDWLYPLRAVKKIGFENLEKLEVTVKYKTLRLTTKTNDEFVVNATNRYFTTSQGPDLREWVREQIAGMDLAGIEVFLKMA